MIKYEVRQEPDLTWTAYLPAHDMTVTNFADERQATTFAAWITAEDPSPAWLTPEDPS